MVITHKRVNANRAREAVQDMHDFMNALPTVFTIVASAGLGTEGGWFVWKMVGHDFEVWIGGRQTGGVAWATANANLITNYAINWAFAPGGGWDPATDDPNGTMFSLSDAGGTNWSKIRGATGGNFFTVSANDWNTIWYDATLGFFAMLWDHTQDNEWDEGFAVIPFTSRFGAVDTDTYIGLGGVPGYGTTNDWMCDVAGGCSMSHMVLPSGVAYQQDSTVRIESPRQFTVATQPNPITGDYDMEAIGFWCDVAGSQHNRGLLHTDAIRQVSDGLNARITLATGTWVVPRTGARCALPWDNQVL